MNFWDSSALVTLLVSEPSSKRALSLYKQDPDMLVWWASELECVSALSRLERDNARNAPAVEQALDRLNTLKRSWSEVQPVTAVRETARRLLRAYALRTSDALQLAAAIVASEHQPANLGFACFDRRLVDAAKREGFTCRL